MFDTPRMMREQAHTVNGQQRTLAGIIGQAAFSSVPAVVLQNGGIMICVWAAKLGD